MFDRTMKPESLIDTKGLRQAAIFAALYNAASKIGHGKKNPGPDTITEIEAQALLDEQSGKCRAFDYLHGKRLKLDLTRAEADGIIANQYDYGQGHGTAATAIEILRRTGDPCHPDIIALQSRSAVQARIAEAPLPDSGTVSTGNLAEAMGITDWSTPGEPDLEYERLRRIPCVTINL